MADESVELNLTATDDASDKIRDVARALDGLDDATADIFRGAALERIPSANLQEVPILLYHFHTFRGSSPSPPDHLS